MHTWRKLITLHRLHNNFDRRNNEISEESSCDDCLDQAESRNDLREENLQNIDTDMRSIANAIADTGVYEPNEAVSGTFLRPSQRRLQHIAEEYMDAHHRDDASQEQGHQDLVHVFVNRMDNVRFH